MMTLEISSEDGGVLIRAGTPNLRSDVWFSRYFWREGVQESVSNFLPHAHVEIQNVKVSEK